MNGKCDKQIGMPAHTCNRKAHYQMASRKFPWMVHEYCARCAPMDALPILDRERFDLQR